MRRRLPSEPKHLIEELTSWIEWRHAASRRRLVLTSAPVSLPAALERWMPSSVWRLAWQANGVAVLYGLAPSDRPSKFFVIRHDASASMREGVFEHLPDGTWQLLEGEGLAPGPAGRRCRVEKAASYFKRGSASRRNPTFNKRRRLQSR